MGKLMAEDKHDTETKKEIERLREEVEERDERVMYLQQELDERVRALKGDELISFVTSSPTVEDIPHIGLIDAGVVDDDDDGAEGADDAVKTYTATDTLIDLETW